MAAIAMRKVTKSKSEIFVMMQLIKSGVDYRMFTVRLCLRGHKASVLQ